MICSNDWPCAALPRAELSARTTLRVGGRVEWLLEPATPEELGAAVAAARGRGLPTRILGGGANLIVADGLLPGVVISTTRMQRLFRPGPGVDPTWRPREDADAGEEDDARLVAWCGVTLPRLVRTAQQLGWSGLEGIVGVPGCVGGGVTMNAGGRWGDLWSTVESVCVVEPDGTLRDVPRAECRPAYRDGGLEGRVVAGAVFRLRPDDPARVREAMREYLLEKQRVQPVTERSAGCVFKNPPKELSDGRSAGVLVEECGGKGLSVGDALVSPLHGNFILNAGDATATDVFSLIGLLRERVAERTGIRLETEVRTWPEEAGGSA